MIFATFKGAGGDVTQLLLAFLAKPHDQILITCLLVCWCACSEADDFLYIFSYFRAFLPD